MEKRKVTVTIGGQRCSFYSDDPDEYIAALAEKANTVVEQFSGMNAKAILFLADALMRAEKAEKPAEEAGGLKAEAKAEPKRAGKGTKVPADKNQVSVWDLMKANAENAVE